MQPNALFPGLNRLRLLVNRAVGVACAAGYAGAHGSWEPGNPVPGNAVGVPVTGVVCCEGGLLTCGHDGVVQHFQLRRQPCGSASMEEALM